MVLVGNEGHNRVGHIYICFNGKNLRKPLTPQNSKNYLQGDLMQNQVVKSCLWSVIGATIKKSNFACVYMEILANMTQVSDMAPGPLVNVIIERSVTFNSKF
jgi:hypothetical protein